MSALLTRCANKVGPEPSHKYRSHRGIRSATQILARKAQRKENSRRIRREYRQVRKRWVELAKTPAKPTLAQERILAEELYSQPQPNTDRSDYKHPPCNNLKIVHTDLRIATFNLKGMNYIAARQQIVYLMQKHNIHVAALQETHINYTGKEQHGDYNFYFSSNIDDEQRKETDIQLEALNQRLRKKQITEVEAKRERMTIINRSTEKLGVGFLYKKSFFDSAEIDIKSLNNRVMSMKIHSTPIPINIINLYAPHAGHSAQTKMEFYNLAHQLTQEIPSHSIKIIVGDFNARLIEALPHEQHLIGAHVYCAENNSIHDLTNEQIDNRHNFINFCLENNLVPMNTWFQKPKPKLATYRNATAPVFDLEQIDSTKFAQIDYVLINSAWRNAVTNVENVHHTIINSDHALLIATLKVKLATKKRFKIPTNIKYREPTSAQIEAYNESI